MIAPALLRGQARYERVMDGRCDNTDGEAFRHVVRLRDPERAVELVVEARPSPTYAIVAARLQVVEGDVAEGVVSGVPSLAGAAMVGGFTRRVAEAVDGER